MIDKTALAHNIGNSEARLSELENYIRISDGKLAKAKSNRTWGVVALAIGVLGLLFYSPGLVVLLWLLLIAAGGLTLFTAVLNQRQAQKERDGYQEYITQTRAKLAEQRALIMGG